jgi:hypothetical protein
MADPGLQVGALAHRVRPGAQLLKLSGAAATYCARIIELAAMAEWIDAAKAEPEAVPELDFEF